MNEDVLRLPATLAGLPHVRKFVLDRARLSRVPPDAESRIDLVLEELWVNVANHAYPGGTGDVEAECFERGGKGAQRFCLRLRDRGVPFDPLSRAAPSLDDDLEDRPIGGMGILLVTKNCDGLEYERDGDANVVTACFDLPG